MSTPERGEPGERGMVVAGKVVGPVVNPNDDGHCWACDDPFEGGPVLVTRGVVVCSPGCHAAATEAISGARWWPVPLVPLLLVFFGGALYCLWSLLLWKVKGQA